MGVGPLLRAKPEALTRVECRVPPRAWQQHEVAGKLRARRRCRRALLWRQHPRRRHRQPPPRHRPLHFFLWDLTRRHKIPALLTGDESQDSLTVPCEKRSKRGVFNQLERGACLSVERGVGRLDPPHRGGRRRRSASCRGRWTRSPRAGPHARRGVGTGRAWQSARS
jgi:hypothetical protein